MENLRNEFLGVEISVVSVLEWRISVMNFLGVEISVASFLDWRISVMSFLEWRFLLPVSWSGDTP